MDWSFARRMMVERQLRARGLRDERVLAAMLAIPREEFIAEHLRGQAYADEPVAIGYGQTISQPYMTALMAECLERKGTETVLEVGGGCGYAAAVLGALAARVISIEIIPELAAVAQSTLERLGLNGNVTVINADGSRGYPPLAPYDAISVPAAAERVPQALEDQLNDPGVLAIPIGSPNDQELLVIRKAGGAITSRVAAYCRFVPLKSY